MAFKRPTKNFFSNKVFLLITVLFEGTFTAFSEIKSPEEVTEK
jgi:hypothetical protein